MRTYWKVLAMVLLCVTASACVEQRDVLPEEVLSQVEVASFENTTIRVWGDLQESEIEQARIPKERPFLKSYKDATTGKDRQDFLVLSGGGAKGAFGAGLLNGWTTSGTRPEFAIVTGVSTGAIIAPFAFLGSQYDGLLTEFYTTYSTKDLVRPKLGGLFAGSSAADSKPLADLIAKYITPIVMKRIGEEYRGGRFLLVGTTNLDAQRPVIWNMGEIALRGDRVALELFRKVILASVAIPGAFPPVLINVNAAGSSGEELHVDGGTTDNAILLPAQLGFGNADTGEAEQVERRVFVVINSNLSPKSKLVRASTLKIAERSINTLIQQQTSGDVLRLFNFARENDIAFNYTEIPDDFDEKSEELFDPKFMKALYDLGFRQGSAGGRWRDAPRDR